MDEEMTRLRAAAVEWAAGGAEAQRGATVTRELVSESGLRRFVLVEGLSDQVALETLAARHGRDLAAEGICVVPLGGATSIGRFLALLGPQGLDVALAGLCDAGEEAFFRRALDRAGLGSPRARGGLERLGFYVCVADLEDELIRSLGAATVQRVVEEQGELRAFRTLQKQPAHRGRAVELQLRRFMGSLGGRKARYARSLVEALDPAHVPEPLERLLGHI
ncbi:TOPRIM nucleotidyl transferase/hydrolase domain-containing protein [Streptomyces daliensis]